MRELLSKTVAAWLVKKQRWQKEDLIATQHRTLKRLVYRARKTLFGREHHFDTIRSYADFKALVPLRDYEDFVPYIEKIRQGERDILWPGTPLYLATTSGTTSGSKYIPITRESMLQHTRTARNVLLHYICETKKATFLGEKMVFLSGSPKLDRKGIVPSGRLSGIVNHHVPSYLRRNQLPKYTTNCLEDWESKVDAIVEETLQANVGLVAGIPPWVQMYFDKLRRRTGCHVKTILPNLSVLIHGGVNFAPYRAKLFEALGGAIDTIETYPASEGFIAFQDLQQKEGLLLQLHSGIFFEFIPARDYTKSSADRLCIEEVEMDVDYAVVLSTQSGLWAYVLGDTIKFVSKSPPRIVVTGRIQQFVSAFGEHVIAEEVERAMQHALAVRPEAVLTEFTVAPFIGQQQGERSYHEWLVEFDSIPRDSREFARELDRKMCELNSYYNDLLAGKVLHSARLTLLPKGTFRMYMRESGKLGGQNKVVRLANDRELADALLAHRSGCVHVPNDAQGNER